MGGNVAGVLVILAGVFLVIVGVRGTQQAVFGGLFGKGTAPTEASTTTTESSTTTTTTSGTGSSTGGGGPPTHR